MTILFYVNYFACKAFSYESLPAKNHQLRSSKLSRFVYVNDVGDLQCLLKAMFVKNVVLYLISCKQFQIRRLGLNIGFLSEHIVVKLILNKTNYSNRK